MKEIINKNNLENSLLNGQIKLLEELFQKIEKNKQFKNIIDLKIDYEIKISAKNEVFKIFFLIIQIRQFLNKIKEVNQELEYNSLNLLKNVSKNILRIDD